VDLSVGCNSWDKLLELDCLCLGLTIGCVCCHKLPACDVGLNTVDTRFFSYTPSIYTECIENRGIQQKTQNTIFH
jgi:hypothetical protein